MAGFMSGFGTTLAALIEEDRKYYRDAAAKRRDYIQTYGTRAVTEREDKANAALGVANTLMNRGFSKEYVTSIAANNGVRSMVDFADQISKRTDLTEKDIKEIEASAKDFVKDNPDEDLTSVVKRAYGLYKSTKDPVARKRNIFGAMLGLDASMMEDDVLNDMYIDGYTGSDIYRIMGSAGPKAGKPMGVKLPPKARSYKENLTYRATMAQEADNYISYELEELGQLINTSPDSTVKQDLQGTRTTLLRIQKDLKTDPSGAMAEYLSMDGLSYNNSLLGTIQETEEAYAGAITRNPLFTDKFKTTYGQLVGDIQDDAAAPETTETSVTTPKAPDVTTDIKQPPKGSTITEAGEIRFETVADRDAAVEAGTIPLNAMVKVGDGEAVPFTPPSSYEPVDTSKPVTYSTNIEDARALASVLEDQGVETYPVVRKDGEGVLVQVGAYATQEDAEAAYKKIKNTIIAATLASPFMPYPEDYEPIYEASESGGTKFVRLRLQVPNKKPTDLGDMTGAPGFRERDNVFDPKPELTVEDRIKAKREATTEVAGAISDVAEDVSSKLKAFDSTLDVAAGNAMLGIRAKANTVLGALAQVSGNDELADSFYRVSVEAEDGTRKGVSFDRGLVDGLNQVLDDLGVPDYSEVKDMPEAVNQYVDEPNTEGRDLDADLGVGYEPATTRLFSTMDRLKKLRLAINEAPEDVTPEVVLEAVAKPDLGMEERIRDDARQFLQDEKSFPQPLPTVVIDDLADGVVDVVQKLIKNRKAPSQRDVDALKNRLKSSQYRGPISDKTLKEKLDDIYNFYTQEEPEYNPRTVGTVGFQDLGLRNPADDVLYPRSESPDAQTKIRTPLGDTRTDAEPTLPASMTVEQMTTRGKKARPSGLMSPPSSGTAPKLGQAEFGDLINRVHGSSKAAEAFNNKVSSGKVTAADVTRLIKATRKLPKTKSKDNLLQSLFDLRDALNKR